MDARRGADRNRPQPAGRSRARHDRRDCRLDGSAARRHRGRAGQAGRRRLDHERLVHPGRSGDRMVRPRAARAHSSLYGQAAAAGDRARLEQGFSSLPVPLAACDSERAAAGTRRARRGHRAAAGIRGAGGGMGIRDSSGAPGGLRVHLARRLVSFRPRRLDALEPHRESGSGRPRSDPHDAGHLAAAPQRSAVDPRRAAARHQDRGIGLARPSGRRDLARARRLVLRRDRPGNRTVAHAGRRRAGRACRGGTGRRRTASRACARC